MNKLKFSLRPVTRRCANGRHPKSLTREQQLLLPIILALRALPRLHGAMGLQKGLPLSSVCQIFGVHAGQVHGQIQQHVRRQHADDAHDVTHLPLFYMTLGLAIEILSLRLSLQ